MSAFQAYMICTSPRSGSTLLCRLLREAGQAGHPDSHFHAPSLEKWLGHYDLEQREFPTNAEALRAVFREAIARGKANSNLFGLRMQRHSFPFFLDQLAVVHPGPPTDNTRIEAAFGRTLFIHLTRENKLDQAISYVRAEQSGLWHKASDGTEIERLSAPQDPVFDAPAIAAQLAASEQMDRDWAAWFAAQNITPLRITYDALSAAPYATLNIILNALGVAEQPKGTTVPTAKLADAINAEWAKRFRAEQGP